jgi:hypothetical protein
MLGQNVHQRCSTGTQRLRRCKGLLAALDKLDRGEVDVLVASKIGEGVCDSRAMRKARG